MLARTINHCIYAARSHPPFSHPLSLDRSFSDNPFGTRLPHAKFPEIVQALGRGGFRPYPDYPYFLSDIWFFNRTTGQWTEVCYKGYPGLGNRSIFYPYGSVGKHLHR